MQIIGGPAIRRAETGVVYIWIVTDERPASIVVLGGLTDEVSVNTLIAKGSARSADIISLGSHLHAALVPLKPINAAFPQDTKIYYDIFINDRNLHSLGLIEGVRPIVYKEQKLPSFYLPTKHQKVLQGSCRKPHAGKKRYAQFDQIQKIDKSINDSILTDLKKRPSLLCFTGDQIYADDVSLPLLCTLIDKARYLTGWDEAIPNDDTTIIPSQIKLGDRSSILNKGNGFTSSHSENHLMTFGEYAAMYLTVLGGIQIELPEYKDQAPNMVTISTRAQRGKHKITIKKPFFSLEEYDEEKQIVQDFLKNTWKMRRVMANIVTYMIFDDHEVTDDWNLTKENHDNLRSNILSRRIQSNALAAYWLFQGWGNNPNDFDDTFKKKLSDHLASRSQTHAAEFENALLDKDYWGYEVDGYPYMVVLDTRSDRVFSDEDQFSQLMSEQRLRALANTIQNVNNKYQNKLEEQSLLLVSPSPVLGFKSIEKLKLLFDFIPTTVDGEPWIGSKTAYNNLLTALKTAKFKHCSIFSGDVHYSYVRRQELARDKLPALNIMQYTSSALHNAPDGTARFLLSMLTDSERSTFSRTYTPYVFPNNLKDKDEFLSGHTSYGMLVFDNGIPKSNTYYFYDSNRKKSYFWKYNVDKPAIIDFKDPLDQFH